MDCERRVADYFIISGLSENFEHNIESRPFISSELPITDVTVIFKGLGEECPSGYECIETTPGGYEADLNYGNFKSSNIHVCYRRGDDKPPLIEVGVYHEDKDRVLPDIEIVTKTFYGRCANTGNTRPNSGTFITYRRAKSRKPYSHLVVVDLCIIFNNKSEQAPHAFNTIEKNLNKSYYGMIGSEVFLCYKKTFLSPPSLCYTPQIVSRFPIQDYANFPLPDTVPLFCMPTGVNIELRPSNTSLPRPLCTTFVLTSDSAQKIYGSALTFFEPFDQSLLSSDQRTRLGLIEESDHDNATTGSNSNGQTKNRPRYKTCASKSICLLSRWPFFRCFEKYLVFLHKLVFKSFCTSSIPESPMHKSNLPLEHHISHFLLDVSFPTPQRPTVLVELLPGEEQIEICQPSSRLPLPLTGAEFIQLLHMLGVEDTMNVLVLGLCEQKILLHSLNHWTLTGVAEAVAASLFPFHWQCPYVPLCPLSLHGIINAPLPFIVGIDSRCFDTFTPPDDVVCIDLDTKRILWPESKRSLNSRILPRRAARVLKSSLEKIHQKLSRVFQGINQSPQHRSLQADEQRKQLEKRLELEIQEAFIRFMATILRGFRSYLLPITRAPTVGATDPTSLFNFNEFLASRGRSYNQFYQQITRTQMFTHYIEERSFVSDKDTSLAFFDDCEEKLASSEDILFDRPVRLFDEDDGIIQTDRSVFIPAPEQSPSVSLRQDNDESNPLDASNKSSNETSPMRKCKFGPLNPTLFHRHPQTYNLSPLNSAFNGFNLNQNCSTAKSPFHQLPVSENATTDLNAAFSISRRTKQEIRACQLMAKKSAGLPEEWCKYIASCCFSLWFSTLPSYISYCKAKQTSSDNETSEENAKSTSRILRYAFATIIRMQRLELTTDEICFRILTLLCGYHGQPALAVRVFFEMKKAGIKPNAVTYGYYNKAVLESRWPDHSSRPTTVLWTKIRNVISGIALFKFHGRLRKQQRNQPSFDSIGDPNFYSPQAIDVVDRASSSPVLDEASSAIFQPNTPVMNRTMGSFDHESYYDQQWSKWTSTQNSKRVYEGLKSAATGIVSQLQEIKSSFSISNSNTPSKFLSDAQRNRSTTTMEKISQWTNYLSQNLRHDDCDSDTLSTGSNEPLRQPNDGFETQSQESEDPRFCYKLFTTLEKREPDSGSMNELIHPMHAMKELSAKSDDKVAIEINMSTTSRCNMCNNLLYDEEIMERWSHHESNLNTKCVHCRAKIVPMMSVEVHDRRFQNDKAQVQNHQLELSNGRDTNAVQNVTADLVDLNFSNPEQSRDLSYVEETARVAGLETNSPEKQAAQSEISCPEEDQLQEYSLHRFSVPYLSPIVLRKELESVFESSGDNCPSCSRFIEEHPILYWNLLWYFDRINVNTHLALLCLESEMFLTGKKALDNTQLLNQVVVRTDWERVDPVLAMAQEPIDVPMQVGSNPSAEIEPSNVG